MKGKSFATVSTFVPGRFVFFWYLITYTDIYVQHILFALLSVLKFSFYSNQFNALAAIGFVICYNQIEKLAHFGSSEV